MTRALALAIALGLAVAAPVAAAPVAPRPVSPSAGAYPDHGFEYRVSLTQLSVFNAAPLAYSPVEFGWRMANGLRIRSGLDIFFYDGDEADPKSGGAQTAYSYSMQDWRTTLAYDVALPFAVHPVVGLCVDFVWGSRQLAHPALNASNNPQGSWGGIGPGGLLGLEYRSSAHWASSLEARYSLPLGAPGPVAAADLGLSYLF